MPRLRVTAGTTLFGFLSKRWQVFSARRLDRQDIQDLRRIGSASVIEECDRLEQEMRVGAVFEVAIWSAPDCTARAGQSLTLFVGERGKVFAEFLTELHSHGAVVQRIEDPRS